MDFDSLCDMVTSQCEIAPTVSSQPYFFPKHQLVTEEGGSWGKSFIVRP